MEHRYCNRFDFFIGAYTVGTYFHDLDRNENQERDVTHFKIQDHAKLPVFRILAGFVANPDPVVPCLNADPDPALCWFFSETPFNSEQCTVFLLSLQKVKRFFG